MTGADLGAPASLHKLKADSLLYSLKTFKKTRGVEMNAPETSKLYSAVKKTFLPEAFRNI